MMSKTEVIRKQQAEIKTMREALDKCKPIIEAVAHIGIDFGYGEYKLESKHVTNSRELFNELKALERDDEGQRTSDSGC